MAEEEAARRACPSMASGRSSSPAAGAAEVPVHSAAATPACQLAARVPPEWAAAEAAAAATTPLRYPAPVGASTVSPAARAATSAVPLNPIVTLLHPAVAAARMISVLPAVAVVAVSSAV